jgi:hypothetical protein
VGLGCKIYPMKSISDFFNKVDEIKKIISDEGCDFPLFRGHANGSWNLIPTLLRIIMEKAKSNSYYKEPFHLEAPFFHDFVSLAGNNIKSRSSWEILFLMRHYGVPTRLLDWTENLFAALYFALVDTIEQPKNPCVWILNPFKLNGLTSELEPFVINPEFEFKDGQDYFEMFCKTSYIGKTPPNTFIPKLPIALYPSRQNERLIAQSGLFTMHGTEINCLSTWGVTYKIEIPVALQKELTNIVKVSGFNRFSVYRDFDSLATYLKEQYDC